MTAAEREVYADILECLVDAILKLEEARGIAASEWGEKDARTRSIEHAWTEAYSLRKWAMQAMGLPE